MGGKEKERAEGKTGWKKERGRERRERGRGGKEGAVIDRDENSLFQALDGDIEAYCPSPQKLEPETT